MAQQRLAGEQCIARRRRAESETLGKPRHPCEAIELMGKRPKLAGDLSAEATDQPGRFMPDPFMRLAHGLAVPEDLLGIPSIQVHEAMSREDGGKANQKRDQTDVNPRETHQTPSNLSNCHTGS
jgi:hypothetical protein